MKLLLAGIVIGVLITCGSVLASRDDPPVAALPATPSSTPLPAALNLAERPELFAKLLP